MNAAELAGLLLERLECAGKPDLALITRKLGLRVREVKSLGFDGALVRDPHAQKGIIAIKESIAEPTRKRFTIAHEIGHYLIPGHRQLENVCTSREVESWRVGLAPAELEANEFAAELLLPLPIVRQEVENGEPSLRRIAQVASAFDTSLTATARRFIDLTEAACAVLWCRRGSARWYHRSRSFPYYLPLPELPHPDSIAGRLFQGQTAPSSFVAIDADLWLRSHDAENAGTLLENSVYLRNYEAVLSIVWLQQVPEQIDEDELRAELDPADFTMDRKRFSRG